MHFRLTESDKHSKCGLSDISHFEYVIHMSPHMGKLARKQTVGGIPPISAHGAVLSGDTPPALGTWGLLMTHSPPGGGTHCWTAWRRVSGCDKQDTECSRTACQRLCSKRVEMISEAEEARGAWWKNGHNEKEHTGSRNRELAYYMRRWSNRGMEERAEEIAQNAGHRTVWTSHEKPVLRRDREGLAASNQILEGEAGVHENEATCKQIRVRPFLSCRKPLFPRWKRYIEFREGMINKFRSTDSLLWTVRCGR